MIDLSDVPVVDNHVHPWRAATRRLRLDELAGQVVFSDTALTSVRQPFLPAAELEPMLDRLRETNFGTGYLRRELARGAGRRRRLGVGTCRAERRGRNRLPRLDRSSVRR